MKDSNSFIHGIDESFTIQTESQLVRFVTNADIPGLLELEHLKWTEEQAATDQVFQQRILAYPKLCFAVFCKQTGKVLASAFLKPITKIEIDASPNWQELAQINPSPADLQKKGLFGISLSSMDKEAPNNAFVFVLLLMIKGGYRRIYLGSPIPGLRKWQENNPHADIVHDYVLAKRHRLPLDPQLRYYHKKGFDKILAVKIDYFPHIDSMNYGAILEFKLPLILFLCRWLPQRTLQWLVSKLID